MEFLKDKLKSLRANLSKAHKSWTIQFNALVASVAAALPELVSLFPQMQEYIPADIYKTLMGVLVAGNILLRFRTNKPLSAK